PVGGAAARLRAEVEDRAGLALVPRHELHAVVALDPAGHAPDERRVVDPPEPPLADRVGLRLVRLVERVVRLPLDLAADVVEVVPDDVDEAVARVVRLRSVAGQVRAAVAL